MRGGFAIGLTRSCLCLVVLVVSVVGCGEVKESDTATLAVAFSLEGESLAGVRVCEGETGNCALSDASGAVTLQVPTREEFFYTAEKEGHASRVYPRIIGPDGFSSRHAAFNTDARVAQKHDQVNSPYPMRSTGSINVLLEAGASPLAGATLELVNATGKTFYSDEEGNWSLDFTATTAKGTGGFTEVSPGEFRIKLGGAAQGCSASFAWPGEEQNTIRLPVREGFITTASVTCPVTP